MEQLKIFVSSTCYDLSQVRSDMFDFLSSKGFTPVLSEYTSFPIDPDNDTLENCIENVKTADIFILLIGNRYGYITDAGKSITNTEYLFAKQRGIPIYVFIYKPLVNILPFWRKNKTADFTDTVDTPKIFEFVESIRSVDKRWCFEFERAQDIVSTLNIQLSYLFKQALVIRQKFQQKTLPDFWTKLSAESINLILKKESMFEPLFFAQTLKDELKKFEDLKLDLEYQILFGHKKSLVSSKTELLDWMTQQNEALFEFIDSANYLFNVAYKHYFGEDGIPSDLKGLYYVSCSLARLFKEMIKWSNNVKSTTVPLQFVAVRDSLAKFTIKSAMSIWEYPFRVQSSIKEALENIANGQETNIQLNLMLVLEIEDDLVRDFQLALADINFHE